ncbi:MAG: glycerophosphodiester phosphodiesterase [Burkholderiales bacterium]|nr:glycerophosphodiester phosphodiesterase [Burkholderiales bacterium]
MSFACAFARRMVLRLCAAIGCFLLIALVATPLAAFDLQGHRGARGLAPENTLAGFMKALDLGVTTLELDVGVTQDGVAVIYHDRTLNPDITRDANGQWLSTRGPAIKSLSFRELQRYDVGRIKPGSGYATTFAQQQPSDGERIPALGALFAIVEQRGINDVRFNIETKISPLAPEETWAPEKMVRAILREVRRYKLESRVMIQSFDWRTLNIVAREAPEIQRVYLTSQQTAFDTVERGREGRSPWLAGLDADDYLSVPQLVRAAGGWIWSPNFRDLTEALVQEARSLGLTIIPWTVNEWADLHRMLDWRVDGLITDYPDRARLVIEGRGLVLPPLRKAE